MSMIAFCAIFVKTFGFAIFHTQRKVQIASGTMSIRGSHFIKGVPHKGVPMGYAFFCN